MPGNIVRYTIQHSLIDPYLLILWECSQRVGKWSWDRLSRRVTILLRISLIGLVVAVRRAGLTITTVWGRLRIRLR